MSISRYKNIDKSDFYQLEKVGQECGEVSIIASKAKIFGNHSTPPDNPFKNNLELMAEEIIDLEIAIEKFSEKNIEFKKYYEEKKNGQYASEKRKKYDRFYNLYMES